MTRNKCSRCELEDEVMKQYEKFNEKIMAQVLLLHYNSNDDISAVDYSSIIILEEIGELSSM